MAEHTPAKSFFARVLEDLAQRVEGFPLLSGVINTASGAVDLVVDGIGKAGESLSNGMNNFGSSLAHTVSLGPSSMHSASMNIEPLATPRIEPAVAPSPSMEDMLPAHVKAQVQQLSYSLQSSHVSHANDDHTLGVASLNTLIPSPVPDMRVRGGMSMGV